MSEEFEEHKTKLLTYYLKTYFISRHNEEQGFDELGQNERINMI